jgi:hypothetical protein
MLDLPLLSCVDNFSAKQAGDLLLKSGLLSYSKQQSEALLVDFRVRKVKPASGFCRGL